MSKRPRLAVLLRDFEGGGAEKSMINIANGLADRSVDIDMVVFDQKGPFRDYLDPRVRLVCLNAPTTGLSTFRAILPLRKYLEAEAVTHLMTTLEANTLVAHYARKFLVHPPVWTIRVATTFGQEQRPRIRELMIRHAYKRYSGTFITNSHGSAESLTESLGIPASRVSVIHNGVDLDKITQMSCESADLITQTGLGRYILNIGRLTYAKRQDILIRSFARLRDRELKLVILGEGPLRGELEGLAEELGVRERVLMPGFVKNPYALLARAEAFVLSSCYEGMPTVLIEAMACGCPVISTDCPSGPAEILEGGKWGTLVEVNSVERFAQALEQRLSQPVDKVPLVTRSQDFSVEIMADRYYEHLFRHGDMTAPEFPFSRSQLKM